MMILYRVLLVIGVTLGIGLIWNFCWSRSQVTDHALEASAQVMARSERVRPNSPGFTVGESFQSGREPASTRTIVTPNDDYAVKLYWGGHYRRLYVTAPQGINVYQTSRLTGPVRHIRPGKAVAVAQVINRGETTRYRLANGTYITGNKQWVSPTQPQTIKQVRAKTAVRRYEDVNLTKVVTAYQKGTVPNARFGEG